MVQKEGQAARLRTLECVERLADCRCAGRPSPFCRLLPRRWVEVAWTLLLEAAENGISTTVAARNAQWFGGRVKIALVAQ